MIGRASREASAALEALREDHAAVRAQAEASAERIEALTALVAELGGQLAANIAALAAVEQRADALAGLVAEQAQANASLADRLSRLDAQEEQRREADLQIQADLLRIKLQAEIDVTELRHTALALAEQMPKR